VTTPEERARAAYDSGVQAGNSGHPAVAARLLRDGLAEIGWRAGSGAGDGMVLQRHRALAGRMLMSLAYMESEQGRVRYGLALLDQAQRYAAAPDDGILLSQRGLLLLRVGRLAEALAQFTAAEPLLGADPERLAIVLLNRGVLHLTAGEVQLARSDLLRARDVAMIADKELIAAKATHNLGYCDLLGGDIPAALSLLDAAAAIYERDAPGNLPVLATDRARVLLAAGMAGEASTELDSAIGAFRKQREDQYCAEAELERAQAALATGDLAAARRWANIAMRRFRARGNHAWAGLAELTRLRASMDDAGRRPGRAHGARAHSPARVAAEAGELAQRLRGHHLRADATLATLIAARALIAAGRLDDAASRLAAVGGRGLPLDITLLRRLARAELAARSGHKGIVLAELRAGLARLHDRRGQSGSLDLQTGAAALGTQLADMGLRCVLDHGSARQVFAWMERSRAQAFRVKPVRPPDDPEEATLLAELRQLAILIRTAELNGAPDARATARRAELQRRVRQRRWRSSGAGTAIDVATPVRVGEALTASGQVLAALLTRDDDMLAVTISGQQVKLITLGDFARATEATRKLTADLDALAGRSLPARLAAVIRDSIKNQTAILEAEIITPLHPLLGDQGLVLIPTGPLAGVPWSMLPSLHARPVTVSPSATHWLETWRRLTANAAHPARTAAPALVAGPGLAYAVPEVAELAQVYPGASPLTGDDATVDATLSALDGTDLAHLAVHGHHDRDNVLFSSLDLADGPLMAYDIQTLRTAPRQVVLSACDVGRAVVRPGDEILGFTAALLHAGTPTVISSVTRVADDIAPAIMTAYHRALRKGLRPAEALAAASAADPLSPFVCFGAG
jgi:CHAT domain-containing protein